MYALLSTFNLTTPFYIYCFLFCFVFFFFFLDPVFLIPDFPFAKCVIHLNAFLDLIMLYISFTHNIVLVNPFVIQQTIHLSLSLSEIKTAIRALKDQKAAGPDGLIGEFYKNSTVHILPFLVLQFHL